METLVEKKQTLKTPEKLARVIKENTCVVLKISASWCGPCKNKRFLELYHRLKKNYADVDSIKFFELDVDDDSNLLDDKEYYDISVDSVPTFLIAKNGNFTKKYEGTDHLEAINKYLYESVTK